MVVALPMIWDSYERSDFNQDISVFGDDLLFTRGQLLRLDPSFLLKYVPLEVCLDWLDYEPTYKARFQKASCSPL